VAGVDGGFGVNEPTSQIFDGRLQKQIVLLKLSHELENVPDFGSDFTNNPKSEIRLWLSRIGALVKRVDPSNINSLSRLNGVLPHNWSWALNEFTLLAQTAHDDLKLELEIYQDDQIGKMYDSDQTYDFRQDLVAIVQQAKESLFVIDPYLDADFFGMIFEERIGIACRVLATKSTALLLPLAASLRKERGVLVEVRKSKEIHDRVILVDNTDGWVVGGSIKDAGKKPTYLLPLLPDLVLKKAPIYERIWTSSQ